MRHIARFLMPTSTARRTLALGETDANEAWKGYWGQMDSFDMFIYLCAL